MVDVSRVVLAVDSRQVKGASRDLDGLDKSGRNATRTAGQMGKGFSALKTTVGLLGTAIAAVGVSRLANEFVEAQRHTMKFDQTMRQMVGLVGVAEGQVRSFSDGMRTLSADTGIASQELAEAMFFVTSAGFRGAEAMSVLENSAKAAASGLGETKAIADLVTSAVNAYGPEVLSAGRATDILTAAVREGKLEADSLGPALSKTIATASALGVSFQDVSGTLAVFSRTGVEAIRGATTLEAIFSTLLSTSEEGEEILDAAGLSLDGLRSTLQERGTIAAMRELDAAIGGDIEKLRAVVPNVEAFRGVMNALAQDASVVDGVLAGVSDSQGALNEAYRQTDSDLRTLERAQSRYTEAMKELGRELPNVSLEFANFKAEVAEFAAGNSEILAGSLSALQLVILSMTNPALAARLAMGKLRESVEDSGDEVTQLEDAIDGASRAMDEYADVLENTAAPATLRISNLYEEMDEEMEALVKRHGKFKDAVQDVMDVMRPSAAHARKTMEEYRLLERAVRENIIAQEDLDEWWKKNGLQEIEVQAKRVTDEIDEITARADPMATAYERGIERMRDGFGDFFQRIIVDGKFAFSDLLDLFKRMIAEMVATAAANRVMVSVGAMSASQAASAGGMLGSGGFSLSGIGSSIANFGSGAMTGLGHGAGFLADMGIPGMNELSVRAYQQGMTMTAGSALAGAGAGLAGAFAGNAVFGQTSGIGSSLGGMAGMALGGPLGAGIGSFLGSGVESLFGGGKSNNFASQTMDFGTGSMQQRGGGENLQGSQAIMQQLAAFVQGVGGSNAAIEIGMGDKTGFELRTGPEAGGRSRAQMFKSEAALLGAALQEVLEGATNLVAPVKELALAFEGGAEASVEYTRTLQGIWEATGRNGATAAAQAMHRAQRTLSDQYRTSTNDVRVLASEFDGSAQATAALSQTLAQNQQMAYQLALQYRQVRDSVGDLFGSLSESIRTSLMSQEQLYNYQRGQVESLTATLATLTDPGQIMETSREIERLVSGMWGRLSEEQRQEMGGGFLDTIDDVQQLAARRLNEQLKMVEDSQERTGAMIRQGIREAANELAASAQGFQVGVQGFQQAVAQMQQFIMQQRGAEANA